MNNRGALFIPFLIFYGAFLLLAGLVGGNAISRKNQALAKTSPLDVYTVPLPYQPPADAQTEK